MSTFKLLSTLCLIIFILNTGCKNNRLTSSINYDNSDFSKVIDLTKHRPINNVLGIYSGRFLSHHGNVSINSSGSNRIDEIPSGRVNAWNFDDLSNRNQMNGGDYFINDLKLNYSKERGYSSKRLSLNDQSNHYETNHFILNEILGKEISIKNIQNNEVVFDEKFYVPERLNLTALNKNKIPSSPYIKMNRNDFTFSFNVDKKNKNVLFIFFFDSGQRYEMSANDLSKSLKRSKRALHIKHENNGQITLPCDFFEGIPKNAILSMYIGRGGAKLIQDRGKEYYLNAFTRERLEVIIE